MVATSQSHDIMLYWCILESNDWDNKPIRKPLTGVINQGISRVIFLKISIQFLFTTSWVAPCWPWRRMQFSGASALASLVRPESLAHLPTLVDVLANAPVAEWEQICTANIHSLIKIFSGEWKLVKQLISECDYKIFSPVRLRCLHNLYKCPQTLLCLYSVLW